MPLPKIDANVARRTRRNGFFLKEGVFALTVALLVVSVTVGFDDGEADKKAETGLRGLLVESVPPDLSADAFSALDGNWKAWSGETAEQVARLYEDPDLDLAGQRQLLETLQSKLNVMERALQDERYQSLFTPLSQLHGALSRRVAVAEAALDTLQTDPQAARSERLGGARKQVLTALDRLEDAMQAIRGGDAWLPYVRAEEIRRRLQTDSPEQALSVIRAVHGKLQVRKGLDEAQQAFLNREPFKELRSALGAYRDLAEEKPEPADDKELRSHLAALLQALEEYEATGSAQASTQARNAYSAIRKEAPDGGQHITDALRRHYVNYNLRLVASEDVLARFVREERVDRGPVRDFILGADVYGNQVTRTDVGLDLRPSDQGARFAITLNGTVRSNTSGYTERATVYTDGYHRFWASKEVTFDGKKFSTQPARVTVDANNRTTGATTQAEGVPLFGSVARGIAVNEAQKKRPQSEAIAASRVRDRVLPEFNGEVDQQFADANKKLQGNLFSRLRKADLFPSAMSVRTTEQELRLLSRTMGTNELGGGTPVSKAESAAGVTLRVHESLLNNAANRLPLAGRTMAEEDVLKELEQSFSKLLGRDVSLKSPSEGGEEEDPIQFVFDEEDPVRIRIRDGAVAVMIRAAFKRPDKEDIPAQEVSVPLSFRLEGDNVVMERGTPKVSPVEPPDNPVQQIARSGVVRKKLESAIGDRQFDRTVTVEPEDDGKQVRLRIAQIEAIDGWLTLGLD